MKTPFALTIAALLVFVATVNLSGEKATPRDVRADFAVRDVKDAARRAEDYFTNQYTSWVQETRPFRAETTVFARSPVTIGDALKTGDPIWIVVVVNDAQSFDLQTPLGIVWVRAKDGAIFVSEPREANHTVKPGSPSRAGSP